MNIEKKIVDPQTALDRLREGNQRFLSGASNAARSLINHPQRTELAQGQSPFAVVLGCSDSRVPVEIVFDQSLGDLFVIRVAGNVVAPTQVGSIEFAVAKFATPLVVVLGHSHCGAVVATLEQIQQPQENLSPGLCAIVDRVHPAIENLMNTETRTDLDTLVEQAIRINVLASVSQLCRDSETLNRLVEAGELLVVGAEYSLETGAVEFFDDSLSLQ